jgi:hypothetical protein
VIRYLHFLSIGFILPITNYQLRVQDILIAIDVKVAPAPLMIIGLFDNVQQLANFIIGKRKDTQLTIPTTEIQRTDKLGIYIKKF